jgi:glycosyltransferase involved in cell wall biosynthesis
VPTVVTIHDLAFDIHPELFARRFATWARVAHARAARHADAVVAVSHTTANEAMSRWGLHADRVVVAPHGPGQPLSVPARGEPEHVLYVGDAEPRKNLAALRAAHARYAERVEDPLPLRVAGKAGEEVSPDELAALYAAAAAVVHPALHEGFGLTVAEAMRAGAPVLAGRAPGVVESAGDAALYADPRDPEDLARALERLGADADLRARLAERGRQRADRSSWEAAACAHLRAYTLALG